MTVSNFRTIFSTYMRDEASTSDYLTYCSLLLHSETVSNIHYYKPDDVESGHVSVRLQGILGDGRAAIQSQALIDVKEFLAGPDFESHIKSLYAIIKPQEP